MLDEAWHSLLHLKYIWTQNMGNEFDSWGYVEGIVMYFGGICSHIGCLWSAWTGGVLKWGSERNVWYRSTISLYSCAGRSLRDKSNAWKGAVGEAQCSLFYLWNRAVFGIAISSIYGWSHLNSNELDRPCHPGRRCIFYFWLAFFGLSSYQVLVWIIDTQKYMLAKIE